MMNNEEKMTQFREKCPPFYIVENDGQFSLCHFIFSDEAVAFCRNAFDRYSESVGDPVQDEYSCYTHGSGYEWEYAFRKAFEDEPDLKKISYDSEGDGFYCQSTDLDLMIRLGERFHEICTDENAFYDLICKAIPEGERMRAEDEHLRQSFRGFLLNHPYADSMLKTPQGRLRITPETAQKLLDGTVEKVFGEGFSMDAEELLGMKVDKANQDMFDENRYQVAIEPFEEQTETEGFGMTM